MNILFLHPNFPGQFGLLAQTLGMDPKNRVVFATKRKDKTLPGVQKVVYLEPKAPHENAHPHTKFLERAVLEGQAVYRMMNLLKKDGFVPDVIYGHSGWGPTLYAKDWAPEAKLICFFEWYFNAHGSDQDFDPSRKLKDKDYARIRTENASLLLDLVACDVGVSPTQWQLDQFPKEFHSKITLSHDPPVSG